MGKTSKMKAALILTAVWMLSCAVMQGAERGFDDIVRAISDQFHTRPLHIPFFGLVNFATFVAHPAGVKHLDLAVYDQLDLDDRGARDLAEAIRMADGGWKPFVRVHSHAETVLVYMAQQRSDCKLLVVSVEAGEVTVVELKLNPEAMQAWLRAPDAEAVRNVSR
jgi:hypothetical protein